MARQITRTTKQKMQTRLWFGLIAWSVYASSYFSSTSLADQLPNNELCIQSFNAYGPAYAPDLKRRTESVGEYIQSSPCHVIQLQEVWTEIHHEWLISEIHRGLPFLSGVWFDHFQNPSLGSSGLSIFTSEIITEQQFDAFRINSDGMLDNIRELLGVIKGIGSSVITERSNEDSRINMLNVHLHPSSQKVRVAQITQLIERVETILISSSDPLVITGDFNFTPNSPEYSLLKHVLNLSDTYLEANGPYPKDACTYCTSNPHHWPGVTGVIDYIWSMSRPKSRITAKKSSFNLHGLNGVVPSDHLGIRTYIAVEPRDPENASSTLLEKRIDLALNAIALATSILAENGLTDERFSPTRQKLASINARLTKLPVNLNDPIILNLAYD